MVSKKNAPDAQLAFLRTIRKSYRHSLPLPDPVYAKYNSGILRGTLTLNGEWQVEVTDGAIKGGWDKFSEDNELRENDQLLFRHDGGRNMLVQVFNSDGSVKASSAKRDARGKAPVEVSSDDEDLAPRGSSAGGGLVLDADKAVDILQGIVAQLHEHAGMSFTVDTAAKGEATPSSPAKRLRSSSAPPVVVEDEASPAAATPPVSPAKNKPVAASSPGRKRAAETKSPETKSPEPAKKKIKTPASGKKTPVAKAEKTPKLKAEKTPKPKAQKTPAPKVEKTPASARRKSTTPVKSKDGGEGVVIKEKQPAKRTPKPKKAAEEESPAVRKARAYESEKPTVVLVMKKSSLLPCFYLCVPVDFAKAHMPPGLQEFEMLDEDNRVWTVRWLGPPKSAFSGGWCYFAQDHNLELGDAVVLEVVSHERVKILIFRASGAPAIPPAGAAAGASGSGSSPVAAAANLTVAATLTTTTKVIVDVEDEQDVAVVEALDVDEVVAVITNGPLAAIKAPAASANGDDGDEDVAEVRENGTGAAAAAAPEAPRENGEDDDEEDDEDYNPEEDE